MLHMYSPVYFLGVWLDFEMNASHSLIYMFSSATNTMEYALPESWALPKTVL